MRLKATVRSTFNAAEALSKRNLGDRAALCRFIAGDVLARCDSRVPMDTGRLKDSAYISENGESIVYPASYAKYQYGGISVTGKSLRYNGGPMRGAYWDRRMLIDEARELCDDVMKFIGGKEK